MSIALGTSEQRLLVNNGHNFGVPWVVVVHRFYYTIIEVCDALEGYYIPRLVGVLFFELSCLIVQFQATGDLKNRRILNELVIAFY